MTVRYAFKRSLPIMAGYLVLGGGFGVLLEARGYGVLWAIFISICMYSGSMQYVAIDLIAGGASLIQTGIMTLMVNARHLFYGISMLDKYKDAGAYKPYLIFSLTDETYSIVCEGNLPEGVKEKKYFFLLSLFNHSYWITGCALGAFIGDMVEFNSAGVEFSMTALFIVVFMDQWKASKSHGSALVGILASVVCVVVFGPENFIIPAMISISVLLILFKGVFAKEKVKEAEGIYE